MLPAYLAAKKLPNLEDLDTLQLADILSQFFVEAQREDGQKYKTGSLIQIRAASNRYLKSSGV